MAGDLDDDKGLGIFDQSGWLWFFLHIVIFFVLIFVVDSVWLREQTMDEAKGLGVLVGGSAAMGVFDRAVSWYDFVVTSNGLEQSLRGFVIPTGSASGSEEVMRDAVSGVWVNADRALQNFWVLVFQAMYRLNVLLYWLLFTFPLVFAFLMDGLNIRAIKRMEFGWSSVNVFRMGAFIAWSAPSLLAFYLMLPVAPVVAHLVPVLFVVAVAVGVRMMASHFMRYL